MKKLQRIVSVLALGSAMIFSCMAEAYNSWSAVMNTRATAYTDSNLTKRNGVEYADKGDAVTVLDESPKAYLVRYPLSRGGYKERWVVRTAVTGVSSSIANAANTAIKNAVTAAQNNYQQWQGIAKWRATAYTNSALSQRNGVEYVDKGDTVTVLNEAGNAYYVRYPLARGGTKDRWISKSAIDKPARGADALAQASSHAQSTANQAQSVQRTYGSWPAVMNRRAVAYTDENLTKRNGIEYADKGDNVTVLNESAKGYLVKYPLSKGGYKERWVARSAVTATGSTNVNTGAIASAMQNAAQTAISANQFSYLNANDTNVERPSDANYNAWKSSAKMRATVYMNPGLNRRNGIEYVSANDTVTVYGEQGNAYFIEYPLSRGGVKHRWVRKDVINSVTKIESANTTVNHLNISSEMISPSGFVYPLGFKATSNNGHDYNKGSTGRDVKGKPVYAIADGDIECYQIIGKYNGKDTTVGYGNVIYWRGGGYGAVYAHLESFGDILTKYPNEEGTRSANGIKTISEFCGSKTVQKGEIIGYIGSVGNSTGPHLHFELKKVTGKGNVKNDVKTGTSLKINNYFSK